MDYRFTDLVDIDAFRDMLTSFYEATGIMHGLADADNSIISAAGWQKACVDFHRAHSCSQASCLESNRYLEKSLVDGVYIGVACNNGLMDYATPITVEGKSIGTLYFGQLLHEPPDMAYFARQAETYGYDKEAYLAAIAEVPIISKQQVEKTMMFFVQMAQMLAKSGLTRLRQQEAERRLAELNRNLQQSVEQRTAELVRKNNELQAKIQAHKCTEQALQISQVRLQTILDSSAIGIAWSDVHGHLEYVNRRFTELFGYTLNDLSTIDNWFQLAFPEATYRNNVVENWLWQAKMANEEGTKITPLETTIIAKDAKAHRVILTISWEDGRCLMSYNDISERWLAERRDNLRSAILELIARGEALSEVLSALVRSIEAEQPDMLCSILLLDEQGKHLHTGAAPSLPDFYNQAIDGIVIGEGRGSCGTAAFRKQRVIVSNIKTHPFWQDYKGLAEQANLASCWSEPILTMKGRVLGTFAIYHRVPTEPDKKALQLISQVANLASIAIEHHNARVELERQAHTDFLTGVANRRYFMELAEAELSRSLRYNTPMSLLIFDIDHFKCVNDNFGHKTGDLVLQAISAELKQVLREVDIFGRIGGEEFAIVMPDTGLESARFAAERLRQAVARAELLTDTEERLHITISLGLVALSTEINDIKSLLKAADEALYVAKNSGRNLVKVFGEKLPVAPPVSLNFVTLHWHSAYESGNLTLDEQHKELFLCANELIAFVMSEHPIANLLGQIELLLQKVKLHFSDEEAILTSAGYPATANHAMLHKHLLASAEELFQRIKSEPAAITELLHFLIYELIASHMLKQDREFFPFLTTGCAEYAIPAHSSMAS